jgi:hypothetical protein
MITFKCPKCTAVLEIREEAVGKKCKCSHCGAICTVPEAAAPPVESAPIDTELVESAPARPHAAPPTHHEAAAPPRRTPAPSHRKSSRAAKLGTRRRPGGRVPTYPGLSILSILYMIVAVICVIGGFLIIALAEGPLPWRLGSGLPAIITGLVLFGVAQVFDALRDMAANSWYQMAYLEELATRAD